MNINSVVYNEDTYTYDESVYSHDFVYGMHKVFYCGDKCIDYIPSKDFWFIDHKKFSYDGEVFVEIIERKTNASADLSKVIPDEVKGTMARIMKNCTFGGNLISVDNMR